MPGIKCKGCPRNIPAWRMGRPLRDFKGLGGRAVSNQIGPYRIRVQLSSPLDTYIDIRYIYA